MVESYVGRGFQDLQARGVTQGQGVIPQPMFYLHRPQML